MNRYYGDGACGERAKGLTDGTIGLIYSEYFPLLSMIDMVGNNGIEHRIAQPVKEAVNALLAARELSFVHVSGRSMLHITPAKEPAVASVRPHRAAK